MLEILAVLAVLAVVIVCAYLLIVHGTFAVGNVVGWINEQRPSVRAARAERSAFRRDHPEAFADNYEHE